MNTTVLPQTHRQVIKLTLLVNGLGIWIGNSKKKKKEMCIIVVVNPFLHVSSLVESPPIILPFLAPSPLLPSYLPYGTICGA
jgi:hypothetical protein